MNSDEQLVRDAFEHLEGLPSPTADIWSSITHRQAMPVLSLGSPGRVRGRWLAAAAAVVVIAGGAAAFDAQGDSHPEPLRAGAGATSVEGGPAPSPAYQGLQRYNREAIEAIGAVGEAPFHSDAEIVTIMETRNVCQQVDAYATGDRELGGVLLAIDDSAAKALAAGDALHQEIDITQFSVLAKTRIEESQSSGSMKPAEDFLESECSDTDYSIPVLATDGHSREQRKSLDSIRNDTPIPVLDSDGSGEVRGFIYNSELDARDERVLAKIEAGFREPNGPHDADYERLYQALQILDPVPVTDTNHRTVGYWTQNFKEIDEIRDLTPEAQATVRRMLK